MDVGTVGRHLGPANGYCMMIGGEREIFDHLRPLFATLAPNEDGYDYFGMHGAGHFTKMVHNGIEYGMMQAYGEGFEIIKNSGYDVDLSRLSKVWNNGSVVRSWLLELAERAFEEEGDDLDNIRGYVEDSGEGRWTVMEAINQSVPAPVITLSLMARFVSRQQESFSAQVAAALRNQFGGHAVRTADAIESQVAAESFKSVAPSTTHPTGHAHLRQQRARRRSRHGQDHGGRTRRRTGVGPRPRGKGQYRAPPRASTRPTERTVIARSPFQTKSMLTASAAHWTTLTTALPADLLPAPPLPASGRRRSA